MTEMGHIAYQSIPLANTNVLTPIPRLYLFLIKSYWQITVGDLGYLYLYLFYNRQQAGIPSKRRSQENKTINKYGAHIVTKVNSHQIRIK